MQCHLNSNLRESWLIYLIKNVNNPLKTTTGAYVSLYLYVCVFVRESVCACVRLRVYILDSSNTY